MSFRFVPYQPDRQGFLRSRLDKQEMLQQQRKAVNGVIHWCEAQDEVKVTGNTVQAAAGEHLHWCEWMDGRELITD